ncbi:hypothetical protein L5515_001003 [Caenorhabditis briggsae]|uniref:Uncharacterized protein n=1 Tax=Caenorhabditis briggsae TaxID=6238 RepID=A0AAE9J294_CAEBR|nr:hypothetical protein L5515_001003 [Caenorhabditis briggsae]
MKNVKYIELKNQWDYEEDDSEANGQLSFSAKIVLIQLILLVFFILFVLFFQGTLNLRKSAKSENTRLPEWNKSSSIKRVSRFQDNYFTKYESRYLNCTEFINGNQGAIDSYVISGKLRLHKDKLLGLQMDCDSIKNRLFGDLPPFKHLKRSIAFVRNIYQLYELQEAFLSMIYHPSHFYCYAIDLKSDERLKKSMRVLSNCLDNIIVLDKEYDFDRSGHKQDEAHFDCLKRILEKNWSHAITLQNFDLIIKTPEQLSDLSELLNETSIMGSDHALTDRYDTNADWTPVGMMLFKNESEVPDEILHKKLVVRKSLNEVVLSKVFVQSMFEKLNLNMVIKRFDNESLFGVDEMMVMTLYENYLGLDGQVEVDFTDSREDELTRFTDWQFNQPDGPNAECKSHWLRHSICVLGVEYLQEISKSPMVIANKVLETFDFGTVICTREMMNDNKTGRSPDADWLSKRFPQFRGMRVKVNS